MFSYNAANSLKPGDSRDMRHLVLIALVILCGALLRLFMLTNQSLWYDEGLSLLATDSETLQGTLSALATRTGGDKYQPLYFFVLSAWRSIVGDSEFSLRFLSVLPGIVALSFMSATVARIYGDRHAFWSTSYLTVSAFWIVYSQEVRPYSLLFALGAIQLYFLSSIFTDTGKTKPVQIALFAVVTGVSCFASILLAVFSVALALAHVSVARSILDWLKWWGPALVACIPAGIYLMGTPAVAEYAIDSTNGLGLPLYKNSLFAIYGILVGHTFGPPLDALRESGRILDGILQYGWQLSALSVASLILFAGFIHSHNPFAKSVIGAGTGALKRKSARTIESKGTVFFLILLVCCFCLAILVAKVSAINWMPRHSFYLSMPLAVLLPLAFTKTQQHVTGAKTLIRNSAKFAFVSILAMNLYASYNYFYKSQYWRDDYRSAAVYLTESLNETDRAIMLWGETRLLSYYGDSSTQDRSEIDPPMVSTVMDDVHSDSDGGNVFVAINREFAWSRSLPPSENIETQVAEKYSLVSVKRYVNFNIYEFENIATKENKSMPLTAVDKAKLQSM